jgi:hypothetical protein
MANRNRISPKSQAQGNGQLPELDLGDAQEGATPDTGPDLDPLDETNSKADLLSADSLRFVEDYDGIEEEAGLVQAIVSVDIRTPDKTWFIMVHPDQKYQLPVSVLEMQDKNRRDTYILSPRLGRALEKLGEKAVRRRLLVTAITRDGHHFLWSMGLKQEDGREDNWGDSARQAAKLARQSWIRVSADMKHGCYKVLEATADMGQPKWTDLSFDELLRIAVKDKYIDSLDHPVIKKLRGQA